MKYLLLVYGLAAKKFLFFLIFLLGFSVQPVWAATSIQVTLTIFNMASNNDANVDLVVTGISDGVPFIDLNPIDGAKYNLFGIGDTIKGSGAGSGISGPRSLPTDAGHSEIGFLLTIETAFDPALTPMVAPRAIGSVRFTSGVYGSDAVAASIGIINKPGNVIFSIPCNADTLSPNNTHCDELVIDRITELQMESFLSIGTPTQIGRYEFSSNADARASEAYYDGIVEFTIQAVPLPPAVWLFGSGLLGLVGISRRKKAA